MTIEDIKVFLDKLTADGHEYVTLISYDGNNAVMKADGSPGHIVGMLMQIFNEDPDFYELTKFAVGKHSIELIEASILIDKAKKDGNIN